MRLMYVTRRPAGYQRSNDSLMLASAVAWPESCPRGGFDDQRCLATQVPRRGRLR